MRRLIMRNTDYIPALRYRCLTVIYDPLVRLTTREKLFKTALILQAGVQPKHRVLDVGCGTATLAIAIKRSQSRASVVGIDGDRKILEIARSKASKLGLDISLDYGLSVDLPYGDSSFDRVVASLFFHHLTTPNKVRTLSEMHRVLKSGGELHVADWGRAKNKFMRTAFLLVQLLDGFDTTSDNVNGLLPTLIAGSGFDDVTETASYMTMLGTMSLFKALKPGAESVKC